MNTLPRSRLKTNCLRLGVLKFSVFTNSNSAFHLLEFILYLTNSLMRAKYLYTKISTATLSMEEEKYSE